MTRYFIFIMLLPLVLHAQLISNPNYPVAAAQGVGGAFTAVATGAEATYWNPAGLAYGKGTNGRFAYQNIWGTGFLSHLAGSAATMLPKKYGGVGIAFQALGTRDGGYTIAGESEIAISHGIMLQQDIHSSLAFGYSLKLVGYSLGESYDMGQPSTDLGSAAIFGLDVGARSQLWDRFQIGAAMKNINQPQIGSVLKRDLPRILSAGLSYSPYYGVRTSFDIERELSGKTQFKGGIQSALAKPLDVRFGVQTDPNIFTAGFGLHWRELVVDYALLYHTVLAPSHVIGIGFDLDKNIAELWQGK